jgi:hypothetical protein
MAAAELTGIAAQKVKTARIERKKGDKFCIRVYTSAMSCSGLVLRE